MKLPQDDVDYKGDKLKEGETSIEALKRKRDEELNNISYK
jgi:hypothetical protein